MEREDRLCRYIDLPLQHVDDKILRLMGRGITKRQIIDLLQKIRDTVKEVFVRTTFIVGFPGETEREFDSLIQFIRDYPFERLGCFIYSREENTRAYNFRDQVHYRTKRYRFNTLMSIQREISASLLTRLVGKRLKVLIERKESSSFVGRTEYDAPEIDGEVFIRKRNRTKIYIGDIMDTKIIGASDYDLEAEIV